MSAAENKELVRRYFEEVWNKGRREAIEQMCSPTGVVHGLDGSGTRGLKELLAFHTRMQSAMPDQRVNVEALIAEGDLVTVRWTRTATHTGHGLQLAPTGKQLAFAGVSIFRIENGKIAEGWNCYDRLGMLQQLGVVPATAAL